ncbi:ShlB/FhaC/HecB family hemolysin secretion/activation protein [Bordetella genomosp. 11]|uniref:ShlB/FhaC/HecB family hemolysin secretion/activation protein n=1 Tax=Bordetella genomosp. 11 TaxID=1416808 RepID=UPI0026A9D873
MKAARRASILHIVAAGMLASAFAAAARADGPLRGNPVDALPPLEKPQAPAPAGRLEGPTPEQSAIQARLAQRIVPRHFDVSGVHAIAFDDVAQLLAPLANKEISVGELVQRTDRITALYRERGYPLSFAVVQNQTFAQGRVVVTVVEGYVSRVRIEGDPGNGARARLNALAQPLLAEKPLTAHTLERSLNLMRMVPGVTFKPALELPRSADGATELVLDTRHKPLSANGGIVDLGTGMQPLLSASANSLTPLGERLRLTGSIPIDTDDVRYVAGDITIPIGADGLSLKIDGFHYKARPEDDAVEQLGFDRTVRTDRIGIGLSYPFLLDNRQSLTGTLGVYAVNAEDRYDLRDTDLWLRQDTRVRAATAEMRYIVVGPVRSTDIALSVSRGIDTLGADKHIDSNYGYSAVPDVDLAFTRWNLNAKQSFALPAQFGLTFSAAGQYSDDVLPSSEQISFGSWRYGMGYPQGEESGDKGLGASAEVNRRFMTGMPLVSAVQPYLLIDYARAWYNAAGLQPYNTRHLSSLAIGARFTDDRYYLFDFNVAKPIAAGSSDGDGHGWRFNANYSFYYGAI